MQPITIFFAMILQMIIGMILGLTLSTELMGVFLLLAITRICWIDDNIHNDLIRRESLPVSYRNTQIKRQHWLYRITGSFPEIIDCPFRLSLSLAVQSFSVKVMSALMLSVNIALHHSDMLGGMVLILAALMVSFRWIDRTMEISRVLNSEQLDRDVVKPLIAQKSKIVNRIS